MISWLPHEIITRHTRPRTRGRRTSAIAKCEIRPTVSPYNTRLVMCLVEVGAWILHTLKLNYSKSIFSISLTQNHCCTRTYIHTCRDEHIRMHACTHTHPSPIPPLHALGQLVYCHTHFSKFSNHPELFRPLI